MAKGIYRLTPRVSQAMRAIEKEVLRKLHVEGKVAPASVVCDYGDFSFNDCGDCTEVIIKHVAVARTLPEDRDWFIDHWHYAGHIILDHHKSAEKKRETLYTVQKITLWATSPLGHALGEEAAKEFVDQHWPQR
jgi:hypothetical protein